MKKHGRSAAATRGAEAAHPDGFGDGGLAVGRQVRKSRRSSGSKAAFWSDSTLPSIRRGNPRVGRALATAKHLEHQEACNRQADYATDAED
jgi:hypothetical protein